MRARKHPVLSAILCAFLATGTAAWVPPSATIGATAAAALIACTDHAEARSFRSSGGYSRSMGSFSSRTPSFSSGGYGRSRTPSFSLGSAPSASDRAISRQGSAAALNSYRGQRNEGSATRTPSFGSSGQGYGAGGFGNGRWRPPSYALNSPSHYGAWNSGLLWFLLGSLSQQGHAAFFYNNANDPGVQAWRAQANRKAETDPALRAQLNALDQRTAALDGKPRDPGMVPPGVSKTGAPASGHGIGTTLLVVLAGCLLLLWLWWRRRTASASPARASKRGPDMSSPLSAAIGLVRHKLSGEGYKPSLFRVGMTVTLDPAPFILTAGKTKVAMPRALAGGERSLISVERVGTLQIGGVALTRLYLPGDGFFQLHLDAGGQPDECRYFSSLDEITPASREEWGFWLDDTEGVIGLPDFQAKDGKQYWRAWSPGSSRLPPMEATETIQGLQGETTRRLKAMLYGVPTGLAAPAPPTEYIFVAAVEQSGQAFVEVLAGIDFNPAALSLA